MKLFSKSTDYNNLLEKILDNKTFSSIGKSLLQSLISKLEIAYRDYSIVEVDCLPKEEFFNHVLEVIQNYCDNVKIVETDSSQADLLKKNNVNALTNTKERSILSYPTELAMLEGITDIEPKYYFIPKSFVFKETLQNLLVQGYKQNTIQILKNFNGWSWDINSYEKMDYIANLVYQNIMMIKGEEFLYNWRTDTKGQKNYLSELNQTLRKATQNDDYYKRLCCLLETIQNKESDDKVIHELALLQKYFLKFIEKKIEKASLREDILKIIYQLRFYQNLNFSEGCLMKDYAPLQKDFNHIIKLAITKACKLNVIKIISMDIETNFEIYKYVFDTRIIDLEQIKISLELDDENILINVYDKEVFEKQNRIKFMRK